MEYHESGTSTTGVPDAAVSDLRNDSPAFLTDGCDPRNRNQRIEAGEYTIHDPPIASGLVGIHAHGSRVRSPPSVTRSHPCSPAILSPVGRKPQLLKRGRPSKHVS
jgi:hypothetical protein